MTFGYPYSFDAPLDRFGVGRTRKLWYTVVFLPPELEAELPFAVHPRLRVEGEIADLPVEGAWMPTGDGRRYFIVAPRIGEVEGARAERDGGRGAAVEGDELDLDPVFGELLLQELLVAEEDELQVPRRGRADADDFGLGLLRDGRRCEGKRTEREAGDEKPAEDAARERDGRTGASACPLLTGSGLPGANGSGVGIGPNAGRHPHPRASVSRISRSILRLTRVLPL